MSLVQVQEGSPCRFGVTEARSIVSAEVSVRIRGPVPRSQSRANEMTINVSDLFALGKMAEEEGFEPPVPFPAHLIPSQAHSTTLALLRPVAGIEPFRLSLSQGQRQGPRVLPLKSRLLLLALPHLERRLTVEVIEAFCLDEL